MMPGSNVPALQRPYPGLHPGQQKDKPRGPILSSVKSHQLSGNVIKSLAWETLQFTMSVAGPQGGSPGPRSRPFSRPEGAGSQVPVTPEGSFSQPACIFPEKDLSVTPDLLCLSSLGDGGREQREVPFCRPGKVGLWRPRGQYF